MIHWIGTKKYCFIKFLESKQQQKKRFYTWDSFTYLPFFQLLHYIINMYLNCMKIRILGSKNSPSKNNWPHFALAKAPPSSLLNCVCAFSSSSPAIIVQSGPAKNLLASAGHHQMWKLKKMKCRIYKVCALKYKVDY